jgi:hypothetical protein
VRIDGVREKLTHAWFGTAAGRTVTLSGEEAGVLLVVLIDRDHLRRLLKRLGRHGACCGFVDGGQRLGPRIDRCTCGLDAAVGEDA